MSGQVTLEVLANAVAVITIDNPPLNVLSPGVPEGIQSALDEAKSDTAVRALILIGRGRTFIAGADINELATAAGPPNLHSLLREIEDCPKPIVAALHGTALGGGLEIAMAAHYRVAVPDAKVGQPEVNLGIIPGAEGTQRLPRLAGIAKAIEMCVWERHSRRPRLWKLASLTASFLEIYLPALRSLPSKWQPAAGPIRKRANGMKSFGWRMSAHTKQVVKRLERLAATRQLL